MNKGWLLGLLCLMIAAQVQADEVRLKNGNVLSGSIVYMDKAIIKIKTSYGALDIPRKDVKAASIGPLDGAMASTSAPLPPADSKKGDGGLVAAYEFTGDAKDASGNDLNGILKGAPQPAADRFGRANSAYGFRGRSSDFIKLPRSPALDLNRFTLSVWVTGNNPRLWARIIDKYQHANRKGYALIFNHKEKKIAFDAWTTTGKKLWIQTRSNLQKGWQHVAVTYDGSDLKIYYDGKLEGTTATRKQIANADKPLHIGSGFDGNTHFPWKGKIDDVRLYQGALSAKEIQSLFETGPEDQRLKDLTRSDTL